jgi:hypothetical protein
MHVLDVLDRLGQGLWLCILRAVKQAIRQTAFPLQGTNDPSRLETVNVRPMAGCLAKQF